jgi:hypothetical protein
MMDGSLHKFKRRQASEGKHPAYIHHLHPDLSWTPAFAEVPTFVWCAA